MKLTRQLGELGGLCSIQRLPLHIVEEGLGLLAHLADEARCFVQTCALGTWHGWQSRLLMRCSAKQAQGDQWCSG